MQVQESIAGSTVARVVRANEHLRIGQHLDTLAVGTEKEQAAESEDIGNIKASRHFNVDEEVVESDQQRVIGIPRVEFVTGLVWTIPVGIREAGDKIHRIRAARFTDAEVQLHLK